MFASAGFGITPMAGMLSHLAAAVSNLPVVLHADHDEECFALRHRVLADIAALPGASIYVWFEQGGQRRFPVQESSAARWNISQVGLLGTAMYHLCGPAPFMQEVRSALVKGGAAPRDVQYAVLGPDLWQADYE